MAEQSENSQEISGEQQLKEELEEKLERICLDYQLLVAQSGEMAPKGTQSKKSDPNTENQIDDDDFEGEWVISFIFRGIFFLLSFHCIFFSWIFLIFSAFAQKSQMLQTIWIHLSLH